jgi:hypothetical protein
VADIARRTARCLHQAFQALGRPSPWDQEPTFAEGGGAERDPLSLEQPGLFACYEAAAQGVAVRGERAGQPVLRLMAGGCGYRKPIRAEIMQPRGRTGGGDHRLLAAQ